ncbi:MAG: hypothetical protein ACTTK0_02900, partial [Stomatobaculum sp.]
DPGHFHLWSVRTLSFVAYTEEALRSAGLADIGGSRYTDLSDDGRAIKSTAHLQASLQWARTFGAVIIRLLSSGDSVYA